MKTLGMHAALQGSTAASARRPGLQKLYLTKAAVLVAFGLALSSCGAQKNLDTFDSGGIAKKDFEGLLGREAPKKQTEARGGDEPPIPNFQSVLAAPGAPELADIRRVSIAVTETTPVRDILIEMARKAQVDLEMDPRISGGIIMTATDRPFIDVIDRIADLAELRYTFTRNTLKVQVDDPYVEQYRMDVLNIKRTGTSDASSSTDAASTAQAVGAGGGGGGSNKSATAVATTTESAFWETIGANINQILNGVQSRRSKPTTTLQAEFTPEADKSAAPPVAAAGGGAGNAGAPAALNKAAALANDGRQGALDANIQQDQKQPEPELKAAGGKAGDATGVGPSQYSLNPQAGIITVFATQRQHKVVERYLRDVRASITQQILIEAKILEITLSDQYRAGINWSTVFGPNNPDKQLTIGSNFTRNVVPPEFSDPTIVANWANGCFPRSTTCLNPTGDISLAVQMVKEFGAVRTLSNPRLTVLNNQVAQLKVAQNQVFFQLQINITDATATQAGKTTVQSQIKTVPVGLIMSVQPAVDPTTRRISLNLRPSITRITGYVNDPGVAVTIAVAQNNNPTSNIPSVSSPIPIVEVREMDSLINMESGQTVVMGGLMQENAQTTREGLPGVMDIPLVGQAVSENVKQNKVTELVVFIRATLANSRDTVADEDIRLYRTFGKDPRPIAF